MPPHSFAFGHLLVLHNATKRMPADVNRFLYFGDIMRHNFAEQGVFYLDVWPFSKPFLVVASPALAAQATVTNSNLASHRPPDL